MPMVRAMRLLNAVEAGTLSGSAMQALFASDPGRAAEWSVLMGLPGQIRRMVVSATTMAAVAASPTAMAAVIASPTAMAAVIASPTAMAAVAASPTAMAAVAASPTAMAAVIASPTAMAAVIASPTAMAAVAASPTAKMAFFASDTALAAIAGSSTALTTLRAASQYSVTSATAAGSARAIPGATAGASYILLGVSCNITSATQTLTGVATRNSGSARPITASQATVATDATTVTMCTPLVAPFNFTTSNSSGYTWYFGLLRCDV